MIRCLQPSLGELELDAVRQVFADAWPGAGPRVQALEQAFAAHVGVPAEQMIATTSCTEALFQVMAALDLKPDDEIVLPTVSYIGAAHAVRAAGARISLADVDPLTLNPRTADIERCLTSRTRAIVLLHYGGRAGPLDEIAALARRNDILLIEDAACAVGARAATSGLACGAVGDVGVWSFDSMKLLTAGDGGMIRVADPDLRARIQNGIRLGGVQSGLSMLMTAPLWWVTEPVTVGRRAFMNDLTAAIALTQLQRLEELRARRAAVVDAYDALLEAVDGIRSPPPLRREDDAYFYWIQTSPARRDAIALMLKDADIYATFRYWPLHRQQLYADAGGFPGADEAAASTLLLPLHQDLTTDDVARVCEIVRTPFHDSGSAGSS